MNDKNKEDQERPGEKYMTFLEHLEELRSRLLRTVGAVAGATILSFFFSAQLLTFLRKPLRDSLPLHTSSFMETFTVCLKVSVVAGIFISFPIIVFQLWRFVSPGLYKRERSSLVPFCVSAWICFILGGVFAYFVMLPLALNMMIKFTPEGIENTWFITKYVSIVLMMMMACGLMFDLPLVILLLAKLGIIDPRKLAKYRGFALLGSFIIAALMTPPDPVTQVMLGTPLYLLFEASIWLSKIFGYGSPKEDADSPSE